MLFPKHNYVLYLYLLAGAQTVFMHRPYYYKTGTKSFKTEECFVNQNVCYH